MYRLPSAIAAWLAGLATLWLGRRMFGGNVGLLAAATLVICPVLVTDAHMARADEVLLFATTLAMCALWICWKSHRVAPAARGGLPFAPTVALWFFIALGMLAKGPITPFVVGSCAFVCAAARRDWRFLWRLRPFTGIAVLACIAVPWVVLAAREVGWETLREAFRAEVLDRAKEGAEGHGAPPGYYLITLVAFFFPGSLLTALAFGRLFLRAFAATTAEHAGFFSRFRTRLFSARGRDAEIFLLGWAVPTWLAFEIVVTKFPHYILPIYPALALFTARCVLGEEARWTRSLRLWCMDGGWCLPRAWWPSHRDFPRFARMGRVGGRRVASVPSGQRCTCRARVVCDARCSRAHRARVARCGTRSLCPRDDACDSCDGARRSCDFWRLDPEFPLGL
jgi:4-amino-4-deoxy-L-arabinose transferase-like glycosyltransferase